MFPRDSIDMPAKPITPEVVAAIRTLLDSIEYEAECEHFYRRAAGEDFSDTFYGMIVEIRNWVDDVV